MIENVAYTDCYICKERLEELREDLHTLIDHYGLNSKVVLEASTKLDQYIVLYINLDKNKRY